jgi:hypothetical protein
MKVVVEVVMARVTGDEMRYLISKSAHGKSGDPMATARAEVASHFPDVWLKKVIVHSTSWRYDTEAIVLTFLAYSDELSPAGLPLSMPLSQVEERAKDASGPASVAAHAIRHLAFLIATEPREFVPRLREPVLSQLRSVSPDISRNDPRKAA